MNPTTIILLLWVHFIADFVLQTDKMALNKSKDNVVLVAHCGVYAIPLCLFGPWFALVNGVLHFVVDYVTSRTTSFLWKREERHWFFVVIGADQAAHLSLLFWTYYFLEVL